MGPRTLGEEARLSEETLGMGSLGDPVRPAGSLHRLLCSDKNTSGVGAHGRGRERGQDAVGKGAQ